MIGTDFCQMILDTLIGLVKDHSVGINPDQQAVCPAGNLKVNFGTKKNRGVVSVCCDQNFCYGKHGRLWLERETR
jgi:hypothetical protein